MGSLPRLLHAPDVVAVTAGAGEAAAAAAVTPLTTLLGAHSIADLPGTLQEAMQKAWQNAVSVQQVRQPWLDQPA